MMGLAQWGALAGIVITGLAFLVDAAKWRAPGSTVSRRHKILRVCLGISIEALFVLILFGPLFARRGPVAELAYLTDCLLIGVGVFVLALYDLREVAVEFGELRKRAIKELLEDKQQDDK